jgi:hypothetical protein
MIVCTTDRRICVEDKKLVIKNGCAVNARKNNETTATKVTKRKREERATEITQRPNALEPIKMVTAASYADAVKKGTKRRIVTNRL